MKDPLLHKTRAPPRFDTGRGGSPKAPSETPRAPSSLHTPQSAKDRASESAPELEGFSPSSSNSLAAPPVPAQPRPRLPPPLTGYAAVSGGLTLNLFPKPNASVQAQFGLDRGLLRLGVHGEVELGGSMRDDEFTEIGADFRAWDLGLRACAIPGWNRAQLRVCAAAGAGALVARNVGVQEEAISRREWLWVAPELGFAWSLTRRVALTLDLGPTFTPLQHTPDVKRPDNPDEILVEYTFPVVSARGRLGIEVRFP